MRQIDSKKGMRMFFEKNLLKGHKAEELFSVLLNQGYPKSMINEGYHNALLNINQKKEAQIKEEPKIEEVTDSVIPEKKSFFKKLFKRS